MRTFEEIGAMLDEIAAELPDALYKELNGGVYLLPEAKSHSASINNDLYTLGEYRVDPALGRYIVVFMDRLFAYMGVYRAANKKKS